MKAVDEAVASLAATQHGVFTRRQARAIGVSSTGCHRRATGGQWVRTPHPGVYHLPGYQATWHQRVMTAVLAGPDGTVASHRAAAALHRLRQAGPVELTVPAGASHRIERAVVHQSGPAHSTIVDGIPCTRVERTLVDLAAVMGDAAVESSLEAALRLGLTTTERVRAELDELARRGRPGVRRLRRVLARRGDGRAAGSELEVRMIQLLRAAGLPDPVRQYEVRAGGERYFVDLAYPDRRLAIELDGREHHSDADAFQRDRARQNALVLAGWTVLRFTWADVNEAGASAVAVITRGLAA